MVTPNPAPTDSRPSNAEDATTPTDPTTSQQAPKPEGKEPETTQSQLASSDGAGIRGDYGDASQTNGLEGGASDDTDTTPDRAADNPTNAPAQDAQPL